MFENIKTFIDYIGSGNLLSIILFVIGVFYAFFIYFKSFYRLVYSESRVSKNIRNIDDYKNENIEHTSRIIFYNNGRKTLTKNELKNLFIKAINIKEYRLLNNGNDISIKNIKSRNQLQLNVNHLDSSKFIALEVNHTGLLSIDGRVSETGKILNTEPKQWVIINFVIVLLMFGTLFYNLIFNYSENQSIPLKSLLITVIIFGLIFFIARFIHSLLFIPDVIASKYLDTTNKFNTEFKESFD